MIYNDSAFGPVPWETIIKEFRGESESQSTVEEHAQHFIEYLQNFKEYISDGQSIQLIEKVREEELEKVLSALTKAKSQRSSGALDSNTLNEFITDQCQRRIEEIQTERLQASLNDKNLRQVVESTVSEWAEYIRSKLDVQVEDPTNGILMDLVVEALKVVPLSDAYTGVVVAGFGKDQHFPALAHYIVDNMLGGDIKVALKQSISVKADGIGHVVPFAQQALPIAFLGGLPPDYWKAISSSMSNVIELLYGFLLGELEGDISDERLSALQNTRDGARERLLEFFEYRLTQDFGIKNTGEISRMVGYLTKEDIAELAEALVHLTQLRLKVSSEPETVGGPIDVAVISKGDGLIWIKRKHYFQQELNPRYFHRLLQE